MKTILLDVGGTFIKCSDGRMIPVNSSGTREEIASSLRQAVGQASSVAVAIPGPFDYKNGVFLMKHKFASVYGKSFADLLIPEGYALSGASALFLAEERAYPSEIKFMHDVNATLRGSLKMLELKNAVLVTLGTGLGFAYAIDGKVKENEAGSPARSIWNISYGGGILEDHLSGRGLRTAYGRKTGDSSQSALSISKKAYAGDEAALEVFSQAGALLGQVLSEVCEDLNPETVLVGGQIAKSLSLMQRPFQNALGDTPVRQAPEGAVYAGLEDLLKENN